jgi:hypothetical protein
MATIMGLTAKHGKCIAILVLHWIRQQLVFSSLLPEGNADDDFVGDMPSTNNS